MRLTDWMFNGFIIKFYQEDIIIMWELKYMLEGKNSSLESRLL